MEIVGRKPFKIFVFHPHETVATCNEMRADFTIPLQRRPFDKGSDCRNTFSKIQLRVQLRLITRPDLSFNAGNAFPGCQAVLRPRF